MRIEKIVVAAVIAILLVIATYAIAIGITGGIYLVREL
jgi:hypothetical protein